MNTIPIRPFVAVKFLTLTALALALLLLNACHWVGVKGNGVITTDTRPIPNFTTVEADGAFTINWTTGGPKLSVTTDSNLLEYIRTNISDDKLRIEWSTPLKGTRGIKINLASSSLRRAILNGAVRFTGDNLSGSEFYLNANGACRATLSGNVNAMSGDMNGASRLDAQSLMTRAMEISVSGAGRADVNASEALKVDIAGAGKVTYSGNPTVSKEISGVGKVTKRD